MDFEQEKNIENEIPAPDVETAIEEPVIEDDYFQDDEEFSSEIDVPTGIVAQQEQIFEEIEQKYEDLRIEDVNFAYSCYAD